MHFAFTPEQESLKRSARQFLSEYSSSDRVRKAMASEPGYDPEVWRRITQDLGWTALIIPEEYGGAGGTQVELAAIMEECGRHLLCAPLFSTVCLATHALLLSTEEHKQAYLPRVAAGELLATVSWMGAMAVRKSGGGFLLNGSNKVLDGATADLLLIVADLPEQGPTMLAVPASTAGIERTPVATMDQTRRHASLTCRDVFVPESARVEFNPQRLFNLASAMLAVEQVGGAERCLELAVDYAKTRVQFNRPIGSFQAIKHKCAEMMMRVESARSAAYFAAGVGAEHETAAMVAKAYCWETYVHCASENIQIHGGIGFTWEHDAHLYFKRAHSSARLMGDPAMYRNGIAEIVVGA